MDLIKWLGLASLAALLGLSFYISNPGPFYWKVLLMVLLTLAGIGMGVRAYLRPPYCLTCRRPVAKDARECPHCAGQAT